MPYVKLYKNTVNMIKELFNTFQIKAIAYQNVFLACRAKILTKSLLINFVTLKLLN